MKNDNNTDNQANTNPKNQNYAKKNMHNDVHGGLTDLQKDMSKGFDSKEIKSTWGIFKSNVKEVFGNAKSNLKNKNYKNVFEAPPTGKPISKSRKSNTPSTQDSHQEPNYDNPEPYYDNQEGGFGQDRKDNYWMGNDK